MKSAIAAIVDKLLWLPREIYYIAAYIVPPIFLASAMGRKIKCAKLSEKSSQNNAILAVVPFYGTDSILPHFVSYYRRLGVSHFVFLDLSRERALAATLADEADCTVWQPKRGAAPSNAIHWLNFLRRRYGTGRWCLSVEPSDFLVFPRSESRTLRDLTEFLASENRRHLFALVVEAYGDEPAAALECTPSNPPQELLPYIDPVGYAYMRRGRLRTSIMTGGVQRRTLFSQTPLSSPALNRTPLVRWRWYYNYMASTRMMVPGILNTPHARWHLTPTGCLMRYALLENERALAIADLAERTVMVRDAAKPGYGGVIQLRDAQLKDASSVRITGSTDLAGWGLMNCGQWF